jgi:hypothetical protein
MLNFAFQDSPKVFESAGIQQAETNASKFRQLLGDVWEGKVVGVEAEAIEERRVDRGLGPPI